MMAITTTKQDRIHPAGGPALKNMHKKSGTRAVDMGDIKAL
jgi:hypothetical protein